jgi:hypothetical protein
MSVVVLMIEHLGKVFLSTHPNHAIAWSTLLSYVNGTWAERFPDRPPPENEEERVAMFFVGRGTSMSSRKRTSRPTRRCIREVPAGARLTSAAPS